jgi:hypothetical protein
MEGIWLVHADVSSYWKTLRKREYTGIHTHTHTHTHIYIYMCVCVYIYLYIYIYITLWVTRYGTGYGADARETTQ